MQIYLARHGQSQWQLGRRGSLDGGLTRLGHEQSRRLARWLAGGPAVDSACRLEVAALCASPLLRAQQTAVHAGRVLATPISTLDELREAEFHVADHLPRARAPFRRPATARPVRAYTAFKGQVQAAFERLAAHADRCGGAVLAVSHRGLIKTLLRLAVGNDAVGFRLYNTALSLVEWRRGRWCLGYVNLMDHLPARLRTL